MNKSEIEKLIKETKLELIAEGAFGDLYNSIKTRFGDTNVAKMVKLLKSNGFKKTKYNTIQNIDLEKGDITVTLAPYRDDWAMLIEYPHPTGVGPRDTKSIINFNKLPWEEVEKIHKRISDYVLGLYGPPKNSRELQNQKITRAKLLRDDPDVFNNPDVFKENTMKKSELKAIINEVVSEIWEEVGNLSEFHSDSPTPVYTVATVNNRIFPHSGKDLERFAKHNRVVTRFVGDAKSGTDNLGSYRVIFGGAKENLEKFKSEVLANKGIEFKDRQENATQNLKESGPEETYPDVAGTEPWEKWYVKHLDDPSLVNDLGEERVKNLRRDFNYTIPRWKGPGHNLFVLNTIPKIPDSERSISDKMRALNNIMLSSASGQIKRHLYPMPGVLPSVERELMKNMFQ